MAEEDKKKKKQREVLLSRDIVIRRLNKRHSSKKPSPLAQLHEVFEETQEEDRVIGVMMFWKYYEDIDTARVVHLDSVEYANLKLMFFETIFYLFLTLMFTIYSYQLQSYDVYYTRQEQLDYWNACDADGNCLVRQVNNVEQFWMYLRNVIVPRAFTEYAVQPLAVASLMQIFPNNGFDLRWSPRYISPQANNLLLGSVRIRQLRVTENIGCAVSKLYEHIYPNCYGDFTEDGESKNPYAPRYVPTYLRSAYEYQEEKFTNQVEVEVGNEQYPGGGFVVDLPLNDTESITMLNDLKNFHWCDQATRAVIVELSTLNINVNVIANSRIVFQFRPTGTLTAETVTNAAQVFYFTPSTGDGDRNVYLLQIFVIVIFILYSFLVLSLFIKMMLPGAKIFTQAKQFFTGGYKSFFGWLGGDPVKNGFYLVKRFVWILLKTMYRYFSFGWNCMDFLLLTLFFVHIYLRFRVYIMKSDEQMLDPEVIGNPQYFMPFSRVMVPLTTSIQALSILSILVWIKLFKYLCLISYFRSLVRVLEKCAQSLIVFSMILLVVFFAFCICFYVGFGGTMDDYKTIQTSFPILFFKLLDGYRAEYWWFHPGKLQFMPLLYFIYLSIIFFVMLNVFMAIVFDVYATSRHLFEQKSDERANKSGIQNKYRGQNPMWVFLNAYYQASVHGKSMVAKDTGEEDLSSAELSISLDLLPGLVRRKWIEKKRHMQKVANENIIGLELFPGEEKLLMGESENTMSDWMMPLSHKTMAGMVEGEHASRLAPIYDVPDEFLNQEISYAQLQRLMDDDETLRLLLGARKASDVIRKFKKGDNIDAVRSLQGNIFERLDQFEQVSPHEQVPEVPVIKEITEKMSHAVTDVRSLFRLELTGIIEATAALFEHLVELTQGIDAVRRNHSAVCDLVKESMEE